MGYDWADYWNIRATRDDMSATGRGNSSLSNWVSLMSRCCYLLQLARTDLFLDIGCAIGLLNIMIFSFVKSFVSADISPAMLHRAVFHTAEMGIPNGHFVQLDVRHLPFADNTFNKINCWSVFQYLNDGEETKVAINEIYRILKPSGIALIGDMLLPTTQSKHKATINHYPFSLLNYSRTLTNDSNILQGRSGRFDLWMKKGEEL